MTSITQCEGQSGTVYTASFGVHVKLSVVGYYGSSSYLITHST